MCVGVSTQRWTHAALEWPVSDLSSSYLVRRHQLLLLSFHTPLDSPEVSSFQITDGQVEVGVLHVGQTAVMECVVYGYPGIDTRAEIVGPPGFNNNGTLFIGLYKAVYNITIPQVLVDHSGTYTCQGWLTLTQGGKAGHEKSDDVIKKSLIVYGELD